MSDPIDFFALPRTTRAVDWYGRILPALPLRLPAVSLLHRAVVHVDGPGGGSWSLGLDRGRVRVDAGVHGPIAAQYSMSAAHFREAHFGALRDRVRGVLARLGLPLELPDGSTLKVPVDGIARVAALSGSIALAIHDRHVADVYRYHLTLGAAAPDLTRPTATIAVDLDDLAALAAAKVPPFKVLASGKLQIGGDVGLPMRALAALLGQPA